MILFGIFTVLAFMSIIHLMDLDASCKYKEMFIFKVTTVVLVGMFCYTGMSMLVVPHKCSSVEITPETHEAKLKSFVLVNDTTLNCTQRNALIIELIQYNENVRTNKKKLKNINAKWYVDARWKNARVINIDSLIMVSKINQ